MTAARNAAHPFITQYFRAFQAVSTATLSHKAEVEMFNGNVG